MITVVLRLLPGPLESGDLVGHIEHVSSGATVPVRGAADIVEFVRQAAASAVAAEQSSDALSAELAVEAAAP